MAGRLLPSQDDDFSLLIGSDADDDSDRGGEAKSE